MKLCYNYGIKEREVNIMNTEVMKAMNKKPHKQTFRKWWNSNGYKVLRIVFFPLWFIMIVKEKINKWRDSREVWSEERAQAIFEYYIPRYSDWVADRQEFYFFDNGYGWDMCRAKKFLKLKDRHFWKVYAGWSGGKMHDYLIEKFELKGFTKEILLDDNYSSHTEIVFKLNKEKA